MCSRIKDSMIFVSGYLFPKTVVPLLSSVALLFSEADYHYRGILLHMVPIIHYGQQIFMANPFFEMFNE